VDTVPDIAAALNRLMASRELPAFTRQQVAAMVGDGVAALVTKAFMAYGQAPDETAIADFSADYGAHVAVQSQLFPGVADALRHLSSSGWTLAVCTNKPERAARALLAALDVLPLLRAVGGGDSFPARKPDPGHLLGTLAQAGGEAGTSLMLGDHHNDVVAASGAGVNCIFAAWGYGGIAEAEGAAAVAHSMAEAVEAAERLLPP
jgi:phosphoglycolate phosphatase